MFVCSGIVGVVIIIQSWNYVRAHLCWGWFWLVFWLVICCQNYQLCSSADYIVLKTWLCYYGISAGHLKAIEKNILVKNKRRTTSANTTNHKSPGQSRWRMAYAKKNTIGFFCPPRSVSCLLKPNIEMKMKKWSFKQHVALRKYLRTQVSCFYVKIYRMKIITNRCYSNQLITPITN